MSQREMIQLVLDNTKPLKWPRGNRLPLYVWPAMGVGTTDDAEIERILKELDKRGIAVVMPWNPSQKARSLEQALRVARIQKRLGLLVNVNATRCTYSYCNGDPRTAHIDDKGKPFFDLSFGKNHKIGCPFALDFRKPAMRKQVEDFVKAYKDAGVPINFVFADWEIDGPIEWNGAWDASKRCKRCREHIKNIENFTEFQAVIRRKRSELQRYMLAEPVLKYFPKALVGNYAVYPNDGYRYWYDYFEKFVEGAPHKTDCRAVYRQWFHEFPLCGYTFAMPVVYTWYDTFFWYDFENTDYRWFYNMLLVGSNAGAHTPREIPIITFVHWHTTAPPPNPDPRVKQFSEEKYQELLWHLLLRGHDDFFLWCPRDESAKEVQLLHQVYAASLEYREFLEKGTPVTFDVPKQPGPVVSALRLGDRLLVRRTDFTDETKPVEIHVDGKTVEIPRADGKCQILEIK